MPRIIINHDQIIFEPGNTLKMRGPDVMLYNLKWKICIRSRKRQTNMFARLTRLTNWGCRTINGTQGRWNLEIKVESEAELGWSSLQCQRSTDETTVERAKLFVVEEEPTKRYKSLKLSDLIIRVLVMKSFTEKLKGSNSMEL
jgi:hypothetical protein